MAYRFTIDDVAWLAGPAGDEALAAAAERPLTDASLLTDLGRLRARLGDAADRAGAVVETVRLRRKATDKLGGWAAGGLFTDEALQQASPVAVARHRARRLAGVDVHDLTCSIGGDLVVLAGRGEGTTAGSDLDPVRVAMARHNLDQARVDAAVTVADALTVRARGGLPYADPARRDTRGRRVMGADAVVPSVGDLDAAHAARPPVLRVPPGLDYEALARPGEVELVSLAGSVREAVLWPAELASVTGPVGRRATVLDADGTVRLALTSDDPDDIPVRPAAVGEYLIDPDPAVVRAHLVRGYAARFALRQLDPHLAYLTGPTPPPGVRSFLVLDEAPFTERTVAGWARRDGVGTLEIKQRGTAVVPDDLRRRLRPALRGATRQAATLVLARVGRSVHAYWCRAVGPDA
ncbi:class I SAM-dependent methyltransferase [Nakamurella flava]|uniref:Class I SAM-dependent methyltransferase n=1 Tax=Nakamurella flava TaxID=2576308 RepID=A0A4U6QJC9_9ACTN|nr:class I SAM-dependent methyltransferase [Nakamurella flava]TKV60567.1 class I SAM-dependent methyltransferase [Nakamurella flava]